MGGLKEDSRMTLGILHACSIGLNAKLWKGREYDK